MFGEQVCCNWLCDAIMSIWTDIYEEGFQHLIESIPRRINAVLMTKEVQPVISKVYLMKWLWRARVFRKPCPLPSVKVATGDYFFKAARGNFFWITILSIHLFWLYVMYWGIKICLSDQSS